MRPSFRAGAAAALTTALLAVAATGARAQHMTHQHGAGAPPAAPEGRELVKLPEPIAQRTLGNMRDHLAALQEISAQLGQGDFAGAARISEARLGMSSMELHGAHEVAGFMPAGMQEAGAAMHKAASRFAVVAADAEVTGETKPVFAALAKVTGACVGCHAAYRIR